MKKLQKTLLCLSSLSILCGCNLVQPGTIKQIAGTYELINYEITHRYEGNDMHETGEETIDVLKEKEIVAYVVISNDGSNLGYYAYQDIDTTPYCVQLYQNYRIADEENPDLIDKVTMKDGLDNSILELYVQAKRKTLTDNSSAWKSTLHIGGREVAIGNKDSIKIKYKKVSKKYDLSYVYKHMELNTYTPYVSLSYIPE